MNPDFSNRAASTNPNLIPNQSTYPPYTDFPGYANSMQQQAVYPQYAETIFSKNHGKYVSIYLSYPDSVEWRDRIFKGIILADGRDYLLLKDDDGRTVLLWLVYINFAIFDEDINF
ncbi:MAG TPA: spore coat protein GerQ [Candidatus Scybalousia intestinigallinarum]|nr:spore coat protein GerQ [Candidatus Scybalousia intestinigallinarum]